MRQQGKVIKWFDDKGYGFLNSDNSSEQIFSHISHFPKLEKRPVIGEIVTFEVHKDIKKGLQATNILYVNRPKSTSDWSRSKKKTNYLLLISVAIIVLIGSLILLKHFGLAANKVSKLPQILETTNSIEKMKELQIESLKSGDSQNFNSIESFQCLGKTSCSQMTSCKEAIYYLKHCPYTIMDGDGDGLPCEDQWCGH